MDEIVDEDIIFLKMDNPNVKLYSQCIRAVAKIIQFVKIEPKCLPAKITFDLCEEMQHRNLNNLFKFCVDITVMDKLLQLSNERIKLHRIFQRLEEHGTMPGQALCDGFCVLTKKELKKSSKTESSKLNLIQMGLRLGIFLSDAGWYARAEIIFGYCREINRQLKQSIKHSRLQLEILHHLLKAQAMFCNLPGAAVTFDSIQKLLSKLKSQRSLPNLAAIFTNFSLYFFIRNEFRLAYDYSMNSLDALHDKLPPKIQLDALRQASKACVVKRLFGPAGILIQQALDLAICAFGKNHPKFADTQLDNGFYLLFSDSIQDCVVAYETAYNVKKTIFNKKNLQVAVVLEDLAYALYVLEYSSGRFERASDLAERAIQIMLEILPKNHITLSSAQRVRALLLEEIAIDQDLETSDPKNPLLQEAERLHLFALQLGREHFGEKNVQTAKHYGNLGRLYQSMHMYEKAEEMHIKAIEIKEAILGPDDYEVGLSLGHLASLYNYHMQYYDKAIDLYMRSIQINIKLFGPEYSGLEYDYRGLINIYNIINEIENAEKYLDLLAEWRILRDHIRLAPKKKAESKLPRPIRDVVTEVLSQTSHAKFTILS